MNVEEKKIESINNILEMYGGSATRQDMREKTNVYLVKELLQCNMEDSSLLAIIDAFCQAKRIYLTFMSY